MDKEHNLKMDMDIYTDGACSGNPGPGGWAFIIIEKKTGAEILQGSGAERRTTNNRMELNAVIQALKKTFELLQGTPIADADVSVHTDSQYVQQGISCWIEKWKTNNWKTSARQPVKNQDLWTELDRLNTSISPKWFWIKGHAGNKYNEACDRLAVSAIKRL